MGPEVYFDPLFLLYLLPFISVQYCLQEIFKTLSGTLTWPPTPVQMDTETVELCPEGTEYGKFQIKLENK